MYYNAVDMIQRRNARKLADGTDTRGEKMSRYANAKKLGHGRLARDTSDESRSLRDDTRDGKAIAMAKER